MQVIQLPRMESFKRVIFAKRIVALNETFAPLGGHGQVYAFIWDETIAGRTAADILSVFHYYLVLNGARPKIKLWSDNCSSQNKNWNLFVHIILLINSVHTSTIQIEFAYFESDHTFMSADSFHHAVESSMKKCGKVYTFPDFSTCVKNAGTKPNDI